MTRLCVKCGEKFSDDDPAVELDKATDHYSDEHLDAHMRQMVPEITTESVEFEVVNDD